MGGPRHQPLTGTQWLVCVMAALGFAFELYEVLVMPLIARPVITALGHLPPGTPAFNLWVGLLFYIPTAAGGVFGLLGGYFTDRFGRRRVVVWSILVYGIATCASAYATSLPVFLLLRCATWIGVCVEFVAGVAWVAEMFEDPRRREAALGYTQAFFGLGGLMVTGAYYLAVTCADRLPPVHGGHDAWRYTLLSGLFPAIPLMIVRPFLPESPVWLRKKAEGTLRHPDFRELLQPGLRTTTILATLVAACCFALPYGAIQHMPRIVPGLPEVQALPAQRVEQTVSAVQTFQELGALAGRLALSVLALRVAARQRLLRAFLVPALPVFVWLFFFASKSSLGQTEIGIFVATLLFNGTLSFWGNYLPRMYPTHLRGLGESVVVNIGGRIIGTSAALMTTQLANVMPGTSAPTHLAHAAGAVATVVCVLGIAASFRLPEPAGARLPD